MKAKNNNHHTLFITLIIALFVLLIIALSRSRAYGAELGFDESEVSGNEDIYEEITESPEEDSEEGAAFYDSETNEKDILDSKTILEDNSKEDFIELKSGLRAIETHTIESTLKSGWRYAGTPPSLQQHSTSNLYYVYLTAGIEYTISINTGGTCSSLGKGSVVTMYDEYTIIPETNCYYVKTSTPFTVTYTTGEPDEPPIDDPDPSGNDPSGNDPSGGDIELDGDLQGYLINYFGHKDYTVYDSEETFKEKKFFVSRYEYEVLKSLDDIKILLLCNVGILIVILFVGRRKRNAGS